MRKEGFSTGLQECGSQSAAFRSTLKSLIRSSGKCFRIKSSHAPGSSVGQSVLPSKHEARFQTFYLFLWLFNLFNNLGSLLFAQS